MKPNLIKSFRIHPKRYICITSFLTILFLLLGLYFKYKDGESYLQAQINDVFQRIIDEELDSRYHKSGIPFSYPLHMMREKRIDKTIYGHPDEQMKQWILYKNHCKLNPDSLLHRIKTFYSEHRIETECIVVCTNLKTKKVMRSHSPHSPSEMSFHSQPLILDTQHTVQAECFLDFSFFTILDRGNWNIYFLFSILTGSISLFLIGSAVNTIKRKKQKDEVEKIESPKKESQEAPWIISFKNLSLDTKQGKLSYHGETISLTPSTERLMELFLNAPNHFLSNEEIMQTLWGPVGTKNKLNNLVSQLRKILSTLDSSIKIENMTGRGYQLMYESEKEEE